MHLWTLIRMSLDAIADSPSAPSRRDFLTGAAALGAIAVTAPALLSASPAEAAPFAPLDGTDELDQPMSMPVEEVQYNQSSRRRRRRWRRRELARECRRNRRFRRDNPGLCRRVTGWRERPGACIRIGAVTICD